MTSAAPVTARSHWHPNLPQTAMTRSGVPFDPRENRWAYRDVSVTVSLNFSQLENISGEMREAVKAVCLWYAENMSANHLKNMFYRLEYFFRAIGAHREDRIVEITEYDILGYRATLNSRNGWYLGSLSGFIQKWQALGYLGVSNAAVALLKQLRIKGNLKGEAVLTMDPRNGPFTDIEIQSLQAALDAAFAKGSISLEDTLIVYLYMLLGQRSVQYAALKVCDVIVSRDRTGASVFMLRIPRAKQREQLSRTEFKERIIVPSVGALLVAHAENVRARYANKLEDSTQAPLFPATGNRINEPVGFRFHKTARALAVSLEKTLEGLHVLSERTGEPLRITAIRFRRTVGTRAAIEGHGELVIAELLDHSDTQNVGVYVEANSGILERIDRTLALKLAPLAQAFAGVLIEDEREASRAEDPTSRICDPRFDGHMKPMGNCGKHGFCGALAPIACYTCSNFQPWVDGPHEAVLSHLLKERERLLGSGDGRIASINDRTILAVAEVVRQCEDRHAAARELSHA